jgi:tetratricopeptide (TPR) repeat protein
VRRHRLLLFLAAVFAAKLVVVLQLRDHPLLQPDLAGFETTIYARLAAALSSGDRWLAPGAAIVPPLYVYFLALFLAVGKTLAAVRIVQVLLGTAAVACVFGAARVWFGPRAAWVAALFAALTGLFTFYETLLLPSALDPFLTAAALGALAVALARQEGAKGWLWLAAAGVAFGLLILNRPVVTAQGGLRFYIGNNAAADGTYRPVAGIPTGDLHQQHADAKSVAEASAGRRLSDGEVSAYFYALGRSWIRLHPADAAKHFARKVALLINAGHIAPSYSYPFYAHDAGSLLPFLFIGPWLLLPLGIVGLIIGIVRVRRAGYLIWMSFVPLYGLAVALFFVTERDRLPLLMPLCVGAGAAADFFMSRGARPAATAGGITRGRLMAAAVVLLAGLVVMTNIRMHRSDGRAEERTRMAEAMVVRDRIDLAEQWTARAVAIHSRPADVHLRVGRRMVVHSRPEQAIVHLERALEGDPSSSEANLAIGQALVQAKRPREAIPRLREALKGGARESLAGYDLARALSASGDRAGALQTLQAIRPESPSDFESWNALGQLALQLESPSLAAAFFNGAVAAAPRSAQAHRDLGVALMQMGRHQDAVGQLERAAALDPADPATRAYLARARRLLKGLR